MRKRSGKAEFAQTVCPVTKDGAPDMFNGVPFRAVPISEAKSREWIWFWDKETACSQGHIAARYVSNPAMCVDCNRIAQGKKPIYPSANGADLTDDTPTYVKPIADARFLWTDDKKQQFFTALANTADVMQALRAIEAQPTHLYDLCDAEPAFKTEFERVKATRAEQTRQYMTEALAVSGSERAALAYEFDKRTDLSAQNVNSPEEVRAAFANLVQSVSRPSKSEGDRAASAPSTSQSGNRNLGLGAGGVGSSDGGGGLLAQDDPNSDLVSN